MDTSEKIAYFLYCMPNRERDWFLHKLKDLNLGLEEKVDLLRNNGNEKNPDLLKKMAGKNESFESLMQQLIVDSDSKGASLEYNDESFSLNNGETSTTRKNYQIWLKDLFAELSIDSLSMIAKVEKLNEDHIAIKKLTFTKRRKVKAQLKSMSTLPAKKEAAIREWLDQKYSQLRD